MQRELSRFADCAAENEKRDECGAGTNRKKSGVFEAALSTIIKEKRAAAVVEPQNTEEKSDVANARSDKRFFRSGGRARSVDPKPDEQIRRESDQFPTDEKKQQAIRDDDAEHGGGEKREIREETREIFVVRHVTDAENKNTKPDQRDHDEHGGGERVDYPADAQRLFAESEPGEIVEGAVAGALQCWQESGDCEDEGKELAGNRKRGGGGAPGIRERQNHERSRERNGGNQPEISYDPGTHGR